VEDDRSSANSPTEAELRQQIQQLQERLAFYEGFDALIHDNVTHARELSRELALLAGHVEALSRRVNVALGDEAATGDGSRSAGAASAWTPGRAAIVVHGVSSARSALSLQRFVHALPQVSDVKAREFAGGVLRLDAHLLQPLKPAQFDEWDQVRSVQVLTNRPDVFEFSVEEAELPARLSS
jgi:hypothetical protein